MEKTSYTISELISFLSIYDYIFFQCNYYLPQAPRVAGQNVHFPTSRVADPYHDEQNPTLEAERDPDTTLEAEWDNDPTLEAEWDPDPTLEAEWDNDPTVKALWDTDPTL